MSRKFKNSDHAMIKALNPKDPDTKYTGEEPFFAVQPDSEYEYCKKEEFRLNISKYFCRNGADYQRYTQVWT